MDLNTFLKQKPRGFSSEMAKAISVHSPTISYWASLKRQPNPSQCILIENFTEGSVSRRDLRPDDWQKIWPELLELQNTTDVA